MQKYEFWDIIAKNARIFLLYYFCFYRSKKQSKKHKDQKIVTFKTLLTFAAEKIGVQNL